MLNSAADTVSDMIKVKNLVWLMVFTAVLGGAVTYLALL